MPIATIWPRDPVMLRRLREMQDAVRPGSRALAKLQGDILTIVRDDHRQMMISGIDRYGAPRAPLAPATLADRRRGPGPSLIPRGLASRFITGYQSRWVTEGGRQVLESSYAGLDPVIVAAHEHGARRGRWRLPARPTMALSPAGIGALAARFSAFAAEVVKGGGGR